MQVFFVEREKMKSERWDSNYWRADLLLIINQFLKMKYRTFFLQDIATVTIGQSGKRKFVSHEDIRYLVIGDLGETGIYLQKRPKWVEKGGFNDPLRSRIQNEDLLIVISGGGSIGRVTFVDGIQYPTNISQDIARVIIKDFPLYATYLFLQSKWGVAQIHRFENGTGVTHLNQDEVRHLLVPELPQQIEDWSKEQVQQLNRLHHSFIETNDPVVLEQAEKFRLKILKQFSEMVIRFGK